jgi:membrane protein implicated in regulation of membrane protease activity
MALLVAFLLALFVLPSPWDWVAVGVGAVIEFGEAWFWWWFSRRRKPSVGVETLVGRRAIVATPCRPSGHVRVAGELWQALCEEGADAGATVEIVAVDHLELVVEPR